jgi:hypothetical protein
MEVICKPKLIILLDGLSAEDLLQSPVLPLLLTAYILKDSSASCLVMEE